MKNFLLLSVCMLLGALSVSGQKKSTDKLPVEPTPPVNEPAVTGFTERARVSATFPRYGNLVSRPSFKRIYRKDFSAVTGTNNLPVSQVAITLNKPAIQVGQFIPLYADTLTTVPVFGLYPYISGRLNDDDEFKIATTSKIDPKVGFGGKIVFIPAGKSRGTGYFFDPLAPSTKLFIEKNNLLKQKLKEEYETAQINAAIDKLAGKRIEKKGKMLLDEMGQPLREQNGEINKLEDQIKKNEFLLRYLRSKENIKITVNKTGVFMSENDIIKHSFNLLAIEKVLTGKQDEAGRIQEINALESQKISVTFKSKLQDTLSIAYLIGDSASIKEAHIALLEKQFEKRGKLLELNELLKKKQKDLDELFDDKVYEAEKNAPYTSKRFFWFTLEGDSRNQSANLFRNNVIEENKSFRRSSWGVSVNYAWFAKKWIWTFSVKREVNNSRQFLENDPSSYIADSLLPGGKYKTAKTTEAYDVSTLSNSDLRQTVDKVVWTAGGTILYGETKKYGLTANYRLLKETKIANLKLGLIFPVILDNAKGEQSNIILELVMPDIHTKIPDNLKKRLADGDKVWNRSYFNLKVGIPINLL